MSVPSAYRTAFDSQEGPEFVPLVKPQPTAAPGRIEVIEFFWYGCPHCNSLEPMVEACEKRPPKDVVLRREHVVWGRGSPRCTRDCS